MKKITKIIVLSAVLLFSISIITYNNLVKDRIIYSESKHIADFSDNKKVSGFADNIFIGKVVKNMSEDMIGKKKINRTEFEVEILYNIKGELEKKIIVSQSIGYSEKGNLIISEGNTLMKEGEIYLLATRGEKYKIMSHPNGTHLISENNDLDYNELKKLIQNNQIVKDFRDAYKNEEYYQDDYKISSEKNAYKNLLEKDKKDFEDINNGFTEEFSN